MTLVELLVAIGVLGLLAALLVPALAQARELGGRMGCLQNLRQLGVASRLYWTDHDGRMFRYRDADVDGGDLFWFGWLSRGGEGERVLDKNRGVLAPYLPGLGVEICPGLRRREGRFKYKARGATYGYGYNLVHSAPRPLPAVSVDRHESPCESVLFADAAQVNTFQAPATPERPLLEEFYYVNSAEPTAHFRHGDVANAVFLDGHVSAEGWAPGSLDGRMPAERVGRLRGELLR